MIARPDPPESQAFEQAAVDYLLKPLERCRLELTVARLRRHLTGPEPGPDHLAPLLHLLEQRLEPTSPPAWLQWIKVQDRQEIRLLAVAEVAVFQAEDKYTVVTTAQGEHLIRKPLKELLAELDPERFWQIHPEHHRPGGCHRHHQGNAYRPPGPDPQRYPRRLHRQPRLPPPLQGHVGS